MAAGRGGAALRQLEALWSAGTCGGLSDGQLLDRFATKGGEASELAFAVLVERHGPMVLRICRAMLGDEHEAEDALQATFLVLARRCHSLRVRDSIGWKNPHPARRVLEIDFETKNTVCAPFLVALTLERAVYSREDAASR
jgi:hypothetical protein